MAIDERRHGCLRNEPDRGGADSYSTVRIWPAVAVITLAVLGIFRFIESKLPSEFYANHVLRFERGHVMSENDLRKLISDYGFSIANLSSRLIEGGKFFEYRMTIRCRDQYATEKLSQHLRGLSEVVEFRIMPVGD